MSNSDSNNSKWKVLMEEIIEGRVIPVVGQGLYWVYNDEKKEVLLYNHLAEKLAKEMNFPPPEKTNHAFSKMVLRYLIKKSDDGRELQNFLKQNLASLHPIENDPLCKLARIKPFSFFVNTTYDDFLETALKRVRNHLTEFLYHTFKEKRTNRLNQKLFNDIENLSSSLLLNIYGSTKKNSSPAYTENDILETVVTLQKDMEIEIKNQLFQTLKEKSLLFIGCGYDDWLFRFFIRTCVNKPYAIASDFLPRKFIGDDFNSSRYSELEYFLKAYGSELFYSINGRYFMEVLFQKLHDKYPQHIIKEEEFRETAFISFCGTDREVAIKLASHLKMDNIRVWLDEREFRPGDGVDMTILTAIGKCPVFIPLISKNATQFQKNDDNLSYHIREWERANSENLFGNNPRFIMPVIIDGIDWNYGPFKRNYFLKIPDGERGEKYKELCNRLLEIQNNKRLL